MSDLRPVEPVVRICGVIAKQEAWRQTAIDWLVQRWGPVCETSQPLAFEAGGFYTPTMGDGLVKQVVAFDGFADPAGLAPWKTATNRWESELAERIDADVPRPINLDVGYITQAKWVLATVKDRDHRMYLRDGIFAEVTLNYVGRRWVHHRWTYPSYRTDPIADFAMRCRDRLRDHILANGLTRTATA
ncbi:DUF4416 family protein [Crateriforma conspicua]|uniref:GTP-binding protein n=1 Tax=Crateriforma conspicua TaxID=2527996 RepID=A0A5C5Y3Z0_9PLAN|nr:DUF4416 family protein [Crateriforma conspicua]TWT68995.1 hypothetical protein Pan14r_12790 [Crateriforma conspicua]